MTNADACKTAVESRLDLDSLPTPDILDKIVVHAYAALIGELLYIAITQYLNSATR